MSVTTDFVKNKMTITTQLTHLYRCRWIFFSGSIFEHHVNQSKTMHFFLKFPTQFFPLGYNNTTNPYPIKDLRRIWLDFIKLNIDIHVIETKPLIFLSRMAVQNIFESKNTWTKKPHKNLTSSFSNFNIILLCII